MEADQEPPAETAVVRVDPEGAGASVVRLSGAWTLGAGPAARPDPKDPAVSGRVIVDAGGVTGWDSTLVTFLLGLKAGCAQRKVPFSARALPDGVERLLELATAVPPHPGRTPPPPESFPARVGEAALRARREAADMLEFVGEVFVALCRLCTGRARVRRSNLAAFVWSCGPQALPIVTLISLLVGLILAFIGAIQLMMFGAQIYVANLVAVAMVRVMGAVMAAVIMAGRTGAAFAAQLGTMQVNEEIDALKTLGISPMEFLVLPRMLALVIMMPLLCVYADIMGILGGMIVGVGMLDLGLVEYLHQTRASLSLSFFWIGLFYAAVFGVLIALAGCLRGMQCGRSALAVGEATTSAVVTAIVAIVVATAVITYGFSVLGI
jgi:phospholipid/cholesterol/gamma-HCH transport system permease protein